MWLPMKTFFAVNIFFYYHTAIAISSRALWLWAVAQWLHKIDLINIRQDKQF